MTFPPIPDANEIPTGDMPGDKVSIDDSHISKAQTVFPALLDQLRPLLDRQGRAVISVFGGSGVGKSEIGSLLAYYLNDRGIGAYVLSGDNYPRRIPEANDAERLRIFRVGGLRGLVAAGCYGGTLHEDLTRLQADGLDSDPDQRSEHSWLGEYQAAGSEALDAYLGSPTEIDFDEINAILAKFKAGEKELLLKRMGRTEDARWYDAVDVSRLKVIVVEWTHGNSPYLQGVDIPVMLHSTPEETLAHRRSRARDGAVDSPFTAMVLRLEQGKLDAQAPSASIVIGKSGDLLDPSRFDGSTQAAASAAPMINVYPDSIAGRLSGLVDFLALPDVGDAFASAYLLPSLFNSDLDRGFSVIDYDLNELLATREDLDRLQNLGIDLKLDFILNHASVLSPQFADVVARGDESPYVDFFIDWNKFWDGHGELTEDGYIQPDADLIKDMFFRKPGLPILMVRMPDGSERAFWNTFYQQVSYPSFDAQDLMAAGLQYATAAALVERVNEALAAGSRPAEIDWTGFEVHREAVTDLVESRRRYLGQMDLNIASPLVWEFYDDTLSKLADYGAQIVRLDAFAYAPKQPGERNFLNEPGTWDLLDQVKDLADGYGLALLPEIHSRYEEKIHELIGAKGFMTYDFFLPGLLIHALSSGSTARLKAWIDDLLRLELRTVNMLGCHDGIPLLDLKGLLSDTEIDEVIRTVVGRGGYVKDLHGAKQMYYQVNATYYSALGESDAAMLLARAVQLFMPGKPQVWYLDLFAGCNDHAAVERAGAGGHKEINRTNLGADDVAARLAEPVVARQLELLRFRNSFPAFGFDATCTVAESEDQVLEITWKREGHTARLRADVAAVSFAITATDAGSKERFSFDS